MRNTPRGRQRKPSARAAPAADDAAYEAFVPKLLAESLTADRVVLADDEAANRRVNKIALVTLNRCAVVAMAYSANREDAESTKASFLEFLAPNDGTKHI